MVRKFFLYASVGCATLFSNMAKEIELKLKEGDVAPKFSVATSGGGKISPAGYLGQNVIR